jgi:hypothetical protein
VKLTHPSNLYQTLLIAFLVKALYVYIYIYIYIYELSFQCVSHMSQDIEND